MYLLAIIMLLLTIILLMASLFGVILYTPHMLILLEKINNFGWSCYRDHCKPIFLKIKIIALSYLYIYSLLEIHKNKENFGCSQNYMRNCVVHPYFTRGNCELKYLAKCCNKTHTLITTLSVLRILDMPNGIFDSRWNYNRENSAHLGRISWEHNEWRGSNPRGESYRLLRVRNIL